MIDPSVTLMTISVKILAKRTPNVPKLYHFVTQSMDSVKSVEGTPNVMKLFQPAILRFIAA